MRLDAMSILFKTLTVLDTAVRFIKLARETSENSFSISLKSMLINMATLTLSRAAQFSLCYRDIRKHESILHNNC